MYLEEKLQMLENIVNEHGKQIAVTNVKFDQIDRRFQQIEERLARIEERHFVQIHTVLTELVTLVKNKL
ncbi:hypothetical protein [Dyadobacter sp. CY347]|uniref:hypothetical protein n=1 Tax=Dyadobacter sp. CY347 TaxID=2909336 RepID=UPI001F2F861B|nr:hypothetical protein [Dyadobacter sp. CY347]MCF2491267.1 hypothetical protein [Dyadobacter sp. CY347]